MSIVMLKMFIEMKDVQRGFKPCRQQREKDMDNIQRLVLERHLLPSLLELHSFLGVLVVLDVQRFLAFQPLRRFLVLLGF